jgi:hypothetical protein
MFLRLTYHARVVIDLLFWEFLSFGSSHFIEQNGHKFGNYGQ